MTHKAGWMIKCCWTEPRIPVTGRVPSMEFVFNSLKHHNILFAKALLIDPAKKVVLASMDCEAIPVILTLLPLACNAISLMSAVF